MKYADFEFGDKNLVFYNEDKVELKSFTPQGQNREIRFFRKKGFGEWDKQAKIISRSSFSAFRDPFEIQPWDQILIDEANKYGTLVDENKELALRGKISDDKVIRETRLSVLKILKRDLIWVGRGQMVCHPDSLIYGEIDEIWYDKKNDTYYVGDTKTSSSVDKMSYWYQLGIYIEILRTLNPGKKISPIALIDWVKIKTEKWVYNRDFNEEEWSIWKNKSATPDDRVYRAKWNEKTQLPKPEEINKIVDKNLEATSILNQVKNDFNFISKYEINSSQDFEQKLKENYRNINSDNNNLQTNYDALKSEVNSY